VPDRMELDQLRQRIKTLKENENYEDKVTNANRFASSVPFFSG